MYSKLISVFNFHVKLNPKTGLLVSAGSESIDPTLPDISFMRTNINGLNVPFIPGSSIKGPIRAFCESFLRGFAEKGNEDKYASDLLRNPLNKEESNGNPAENKNNKQDLYRNSSLIYRTFGGTTMASVVRFSDFYPVEDPHKVNEETLKELERLIIPRTGISINRATGKVEEAALFEYESAFFPFYGTILLKNPEKWQIGLLFYAFDAVNTGLIRFGRSKSRGLGWVELKIQKVEYFNPTGKLTLRKGMSNIEELEWFTIPSGLCELTEEQIEILKTHTTKDFAKQLKEALNDDA